MLNFNISQIQRQLLVDSVAEDITQYPLYFFPPFVPTVRDVWISVLLEYLVLKKSNMLICQYRHDYPKTNLLMYKSFLFVQKLVTKRCIFLFTY